MGYTAQVGNRHLPLAGLSGVSNDTVGVVASRANYNARKQGSRVDPYSLNDTGRVITAFYDLRKSGMQYEPGTASEAPAIAQVARKSGISEAIVRVLLYEWYYAVRDGKVQDDPIQTVKAASTSGNSATNTQSEGNSDTTGEPLYKRPVALMVGTVILGTAAMLFIPKRKRRVAA